MLRAACGGMRPKHDDVRKLTVLSALNRHSEVTALLPEAETRTIADGLPDEFNNLRGSESRLPLRPPQTVHTTYGLRDGSVTSPWRQKRAQLDERCHFRQCDINQQGVHPDGVAHRS